MLKQETLETYHSHPALGSSSLKVLLESPRRFKALVDGRIPREEKAALNFGSAVHLALLEPEVFLRRYAVEPDVRRNTNVYKEWRAAVLAEQSDAVIVSQDDMDNLKGMIESVLGHNDAAAMLRKGIPEQSVYQTKTVDGLEIPVKCRPDWLHENGDIIDLKTTRDAGFKAFRRQAYDLEYHVSAAFYIAVLELEFGRKDRCYWWIALEKTVPWDVCVYRANDMVFEIGDRAWQRALSRYAMCTKSGVWPGKQEAAQDMDLPAYAALEGV